MTTKLAQPFFSPDVRVNDLQWREVEQVGAVKLSSDLRAHLLGEMTRYREDSDGYSAAVRPGKVRRLLEEAAGAGRDFDAALVKLLRATPPESPAAMRAIAQAAVAADKRYAGRSELKALRARRWRSLFARRAHRPNGTEQLSRLMLHARVKGGPGVGAAL